MAEVRCSLAFYASCGVRITRMCLPEAWNEALVDSESGLSVLPASLLALSLGQIDTDESGRMLFTHRASVAV